MFRTIEFHLEIEDGFLEIHSQEYMDKRRYEWQFRKDGKVVYKHDVGYGTKADALRYGLFALCGVPNDKYLTNAVRELREQGAFC